jgi:cytochrome c biogenesis protein CcdA
MPADSCPDTWIARCLVVFALTLLAAPLIAGDIAVAASPGTPSASGNVSIVFLYDDRCAVCQQAGPLVKQAVCDAVAAGIAVDFEEVLVGTEEGMAYVNDYGFYDIPVVLVDGNTIMGSSVLEADDGTIYRAVLGALTKAAGYVPPVNVTSRLVSGPEGIDLVVTVSNHGDALINVSITFPGTVDVQLRAGAVFRSLSVPPYSDGIASFPVTIAGDRAGSIVPVPRLDYEDARGYHILPASEATVPTENVPSAIVVFLGGILSGFNPCVLAIVVFLSTMAVASDGTRFSALSAVLAFCGGVLAAYLVLGMGFFQLSMLVPQARGILEPLLVLVLLSLSAISFHRALPGYRETGDRSLFRRMLRRSRSHIERYRLTGGLCVGLLFGALKMPCAGGLYLVVLGEVISSGSPLNGLANLLLFDVGLILPIAALGLLLTFGVSHGTLNAFRLRHRAALNVLAGLTLLLTAFALAAGML